MDDLLLSAAKWLSGEAVRIRTRRALVILVGVSAIAFGYAGSRISKTMAPLVHAKPPPPLPPDQGDVRFGVPLATRKEIFDEFAKAEPSARAEGVKGFPGPGMEWSAEDHRGAFERQKAAALSARYRLSLTQVYLCLDEGIRERWPGPDGKPLEARTVPLNPRRKNAF